MPNFGLTVSFSNVNDFLYRTEWQHPYVFIWFALTEFRRVKSISRVGTLQRVKSFRSLLAYLKCVSEQEEYKVIAATAQALAKLHHLAFADKRSMRRDEMWRTIVNFVEYIEHHQLSLSFSFILVYISHNFLNTAYRQFQGTMVWIILICMLKNICGGKIKREFFH